MCVCVRACVWCHHRAAPCPRRRPACAQRASTPPVQSCMCAELMLCHLEQTSQAAKRRIHIAKTSQTRQQQAADDTPSYLRGDLGDDDSSELFPISFWIKSTFQRPTRRLPPLLLLPSRVPVRGRRTPRATPCRHPLRYSIALPEHSPDPIICAIATQAIVCGEQMHTSASAASRCVLRRAGGQHSIYSIDHVSPVMNDYGLENKGSYTLAFPPSHPPLSLSVRHQAHLHSQVHEKKVYTVLTETGRKGHKPRIWCARTASTEITVSLRQGRIQYLPAISHARGNPHTDISDILDVPARTHARPHRGEST